jgi:hypothetical protein
MREIYGNLWDYDGKPDTVVCITTNGFVKANGLAVMGRGCAFEATLKYPAIQKRLGDCIKARGNNLCWLNTKLVAFPVKHAWWQDADLELIKKSAEQLAREARNLPHFLFVLPRPGCGNGRLQWPAVRAILFDVLPDNVAIITHGLAYKD